MKYETRIFDSAEQNTAMKENQDSTFCDSKMAFGDKEIFQLNGSEVETDERGKIITLDDPFKDSPKKEDPNAPSYHLKGHDLFESDTNLFTDKNVLECEVPESVDINSHVVKDICVDEGRPSSKGEISVEKNGEDGKDDEELSPEGRANSSFYDKGCDPAEPVQRDEGANGKIVLEVSEEVSFVDRKLPIQEFGTRSFLRSFLNSLDNEENKVVQPIGQIPSGKEVPVIPVSLPSEPEPNEDDAQPSTTLLYNSKVESGSITFNFTSEITKNVKETSAANISDSLLAQCTSIGESNIGEAREQSLDIKNGNSNNSSEIKNESVSEKSPSPDHENGNLVNLSVNNKNEISIIDEIGISGDDSGIMNNKLQYDAGETSFSAAGLITFSGPVAFSGSLSLRSDGSATSGRSFAFPILQDEWNSSPVRMAKADRRHFRKHKGWRSGLLCCRF